MVRQFAALVVVAAACLGADAGGQPPAAALQAAAQAPLAPCPGEDRSENRTCDIEGGFVCLQVLDRHGKPRHFTAGKDWWEITGQGSVRWDARIRANKGDSWCVCAECASEVIEWVGCDHMPIRCNATNMEDIYGDDATKYEHLQKCLGKRCAPAVAPVPQLLASAAVMPAIAGSRSAWRLVAPLGALLPISGVIWLVATAALRHQRASAACTPRLLQPAEFDEEEAEACE